ncbi:amino acid/polyamine transporter I [Aspergillus ambiguus]|uniref:amino acid/polyamine transporter I n=1 Tax=Aspergillus ambiguus TaxID=176160 RepID=UPI003CCD92ED
MDWPVSQGTEEEDSLLHPPSGVADPDYNEDARPERAPHGQHVSWTSAYMLMMSRMVGAGVFATPGVVARTAGSPDMALLVWAIGAGIAACQVVIALEFGCMLPRSGGDKVYLEYVYRRPRWLMSTIIAVRAVVMMTTANNSIIFGEYLMHALSSNSSDAARRSAALFLLTGSAVLHGLFLRPGIYVQNALGWCKIATLLFMIVIAVGTVLIRSSPPPSPPADPTVVAGGVWEGSSWEWETVSLALFKVQYAYAGIENANNVLDEVVNPVRMLKCVMPLAILSVCLLYTLLNMAFFLVMPLQEIQDSGEMAAAAFFDRLFGVQAGGILISILIAISVAGNVMVGIFSVSRLNQEIARQGFLPRCFASSKPWNAPLGGVMVNFVPSALLILFLPSRDIYSFVLSAEGYTRQLVDISLAAGLLWLRRARPHMARPFRAWIPLIWFRLALCVAMVAAPFVPASGTGDGRAPWAEHGIYALVGLAIIATATLYWFVWAKLLPYLWGHRLEEREGMFTDGTSYKEIVRVSGRCDVTE